MATGWKGESKRHSIAKKYGKTGAGKSKVSSLSSLPIGRFTNANLQLVASVWKGTYGSDAVSDRKELLLSAGYEDSVANELKRVDWKNLPAKDKIKLVTGLKQQGCLD
jgi:hypothetical protein